MSEAGRILAGSRGEAGLSQRALARRAGVPTSTVARIERGEMDPTVGMLYRLTSAAGSSLTIDCRPTIPTIAAAVSASQSEPNWTMFKSTTDWVRVHPADAEIAISASPDTDDPRVANLAAAAAEMVASWAGLQPPKWAAAIAPLGEPWEQNGTPKMVARARDAAPDEFRRRNIWLSPETIWPNR